MDDVLERNPSFLNCRVVQNKVRDVIVGDQWLTVRELAEKCWISKTTLHDILSKYSNMNRVCAHRVLRLLTSENLERRVELSRQFIKKINRDILFWTGLSKLMKSWFYMYYYESETKQQSRHWKNLNSPPPKKRELQIPQKEYVHSFNGLEGSYSYIRSTKWPNTKFQLLLQGNLNF